MLEKQQIVDWSENPVTIELRSLAEQEYENIGSTAVTDCLVAGNSFQTQENLVELEARERVWGTMIELLSGDWIYFEEDEDDE